MTTTPMTDAVSVGSETSPPQDKPDSGLSREEKKRLRRIENRDLKPALFFLAPAIIGFTVFIVYPLISAAYLALTEYNGITPPEFVGLKNFVRLFTSDPSFLSSLRATGYLVFLYVPLSIVLGLLLALFVNVRLPAVSIVRTILYLPAVLPIVATVTLWKFIFDPQVGLANQILGIFGIPPQQWLSDSGTAMPSIVIVMLWGIGSTMVIMLAALQAVPKEIYEAAMIDGAGKGRMFFQITIPSIMPILILQFVMQLNAAMQTFVQPRILTEGGPGWDTTTLMLSIYNHAFPTLGRVPELGFATAQVWVLFAIVVIALVLSARFMKIWKYDDVTHY